MYEKFTDRARKAFQLANQEAQWFNHEYIATEHVLLGLLKVADGVAARVLKKIGVELFQIRWEVENLISIGPAILSIGGVPQTPRTKKIVEYAIEESKNLNHDYVGTEHLLLGMLREAEGGAAQVLLNHGLILDEVRKEVLTVVGTVYVPTAPTTTACQSRQLEAAWETELQLRSDTVSMLAAKEIERLQGLVDKLAAETECQARQLEAALSENARLRAEVERLTTT